VAVVQSAGGQAETFTSSSLYASTGMQVQAFMAWLAETMRPCLDA
jgi:hypothetical protein